MTTRFRLKEVREARGLSQNQVARAVDLTPQYIQKIEYGNVKSLPLQTLNRFFEALDTNPGEFIEYIPSQKDAP
ncbi:helix-turn-helix domain-containing protein [Anthocerotibacter panamensis]|uniref:helix-turn-helix domain-containing protein n=1 Tax=Anthocerotibacter panamensis TaxID=2857077 RepID=UPI001C4044D1